MQNCIFDDPCVKPWAVTGDVFWGSHGAQTVPALISGEATKTTDLFCKGGALQKISPARIFIAFMLIDFLSIKNLSF